MLSRSGGQAQGFHWQGVVPGLGNLISCQVRRLVRGTDQEGALGTNWLHVVIDGQHVILEDIVVRAFINAGHIGR